MIIKKWNASLAGTDKWEAQAVETTAQSIKTTMGGTAIFDSNNKILPNHLPDSVFDSLYFNGASGNADLRELAGIALGNASSLKRSNIGFYYVATTPITLNSTDPAALKFVPFITIKKGSFSTASNIITTVEGTDTSGLTVGMVVSGVGIPSSPVTTITSITSATTFVISANTTAPGSSVSLAFQNYFSSRISFGEESDAYTRNFTLTANSPTVTGGDTSNLIVGMRVTGAGLPNTPPPTIALITSATSFTLSANANTAGTNVALTFTPTAFPPSVNLEIGDWFIITRTTGLGTLASPYEVTYAIVNNTYELMKAATSSAAGAPGIVPGPAAGDQAKFLRGDGSWQLTPDTDTATAVDNILAGSNTLTAITYAPYTTNLAATGNRLYTTTDVPTATNRLNLSSYFWATRLHSLGIYGGNTSGGNLTIGSTSDATKGLINFDSNTRFTNDANRTVDIAAVSGTDTAGKTLTVASGAGTGTGTVSSISFQTPTVAAAGATAQTLATRLLLNSTGATVTGALSTSTGISSGTTLTAGSTLTVGTTSSLGGDATFTNGADRTLSIANTASGTPGRALNILSGSTAGGTNIAGGNVNIRSGVSTGTAISSIVFQTPNAGASGTAANTLADRMTINNTTVTLTGDLAVNGGDITTSATTFNLIDATATTVNAFGAATSLNLGNDGTGAASTTNIATGAISTALTKAINIGTGGSGTSTTIITLGSDTSTSKLIINSTDTTLKAAATTSAATYFPVFTADPTTTGQQIKHRTAAQILSDIGAASSSHVHGNITNDGKIGTSSGVPIITTTGGLLTTGSFGTTAGTFAEGDDSRLSDARTPLSHAHGDINNAGTITSNVVAPGDGDHIIISDFSDATANTLKRSIAIGTTTTTFLNNAGAWATPVGTQYTAGEGLTLTGTTFKQTYPVYHGDTLPTSGISANAIGFEW
jgi:hypothetical protein